MVAYLPTDHPDWAAKAAVVAGFGVVGCVSVTLALRLELLERWVQHRLTAAIVLVGASQLTKFLRDGSELLAAVQLAAGALGIAVLLSASLGLLNLEIGIDRQEYQALRERLDAFEARIRVDRGMRHELNSAIAGIASASRLIRSRTGIAEHRRRALEEMVVAELGRLERMLGGAEHRVPAPRTVDLDTTIWRLVVSHQARGNRVQWMPSGLEAAGHPDAVTEVINTLLDNAAAHGSADTWISVEPTEAGVEVVVSDSGPGLSPDVRSRLFEWGARGPDSNGQGIGLHIARGLVEDLGGYLEVRDSGHHGTTFVVGLPAPGLDVRDVAAAHVS